MVKGIYSALIRGFRRGHKYDMFKSSMNFTYKGEERISSCIGIWFTVLICLIALIYFLIFTIRMFERSEVSWNQNVKPFNFGDENFEIDFEELGMYAVWNLNTHDQSYNQPFEQDANARFLSKQYVDGSNELSNATNLGLSEWPSSYPRVPPNQQYPVFEKLFCPETSKVNISNPITVDGEENYYTKIINIHFIPWVFDPDEVFGNWNFSSTARDTLGHSRIFLNIRNSTGVNLEESDPITHQSQSFRLEIEWAKQKHYILHAIVNEVYMEDELFPILFSGKRKQTLTFELEELPPNIAGPGEEDYFIGFTNVDIILKRQVNQYRRKYMNFYEVLGLVGGIFELLEIVFGAFVAIISYFTIKNEISVVLQQADSKFANLQKSLNDIKSSQKTWRCRWNCLSAPHLQPSEEVKQAPNQNFTYKKHTEALQREIVMDKRTTQEEKQGNYKKFKEDLNCIDIVYSIKELRAQVNYLLNKDPDYKQAAQTDPSLLLKTEYSRNYSQLDKNKEDPFLLAYEGENNGRTNFHDHKMQSMTRQNLENNMVRYRMRRYQQLPGDFNNIPE